MSTPLVIAAANGFVLGVEMLIAAGAKVNGKIQKQNAYTNVHVHARK
jgi:ankyrin repeat protein